ncbi:MAG: diaminopimelate epimerase [Christensenellaceae bacterium]|jgi:diaminopimelate epimerase|nr:diaminopimelate epimerase [Christensenellaceae bacterium]PWM60411.1 MAG: diaminopimelate epimerase [Clostridia bacterium]
MHFTKLHGLGNDFVTFDNRDGAIAEEKKNALAARLCHRRTGVGGDGLILVENSEPCDTRMRIFNSDGSEAEMCGNGVRCFAKYVYDTGIVKKERFSVETLAGPMIAELTVENGVCTHVRVNMGKPFFNRADIPVVGEGECQLQTLTALDKTFTFSTILLGVPHTVVFVDDVLGFDWQKYGEVIERMTELFPRKTNVNFAQVLDEGNVLVRTFERGCGPTLACGTGSSSVAVCCARAGKTGRKVTIHLELGTLEIDWTESGDVFMTGPAALAFEGEVDVG